MSGGAAEIPCQVFQRCDAAIGRLADALRRATTPLGRRELATAMCLRAKELLECRKRTTDGRACARCGVAATQRHNAVVQLVLKYEAAIDPWAVLSREPGRRPSWRPRASYGRRLPIVRATQARPPAAASPRTAS